MKTINIEIRNEVNDKVIYTVQFDGSVWDDESALAKTAVPFGCYAVVA